MISKGTVYLFLKGLDLEWKQTMLSPSIVYVEIHSEIFSFPKWLYHYTFLSTIYDTFQLLVHTLPIFGMSVLLILVTKGCIVMAVLQWGDSPACTRDYHYCCNLSSYPTGQLVHNHVIKHQSKNSVFLTQKLHVWYVTTSKSRSVSPVVSKLLPTPHRLTLHWPLITFQSAFWPFSELSVVPHGCWHFFFELQFCSPSLTGHLIPYS